MPDRISPTVVARVVNLRSSREISLMRRAGLVVWAAHQVARSLVRPGMTTGEIDAAVERFFAAHDALPLFKGVPGKVPFPSVCCISVNDEVVHGIPGPRVLQSGDVVSIDTGCSIGGWCGDSAFTHPVGEISADVQRLLDCTAGVLALAIELMAVRNRWSDVASEMATYVRDHGFSVVENFVGHGIGRSMHEDPQVPNFCTPAFRRKHAVEEAFASGFGRRGRPDQMDTGVAPPRVNVPGSLVGQPDPTNPHGGSGPGYQGYNPNDFVRPPRPS